MNKIEMLKAKREVEGFELFNALTNAVELAGEVPEKDRDQCIIDSVMLQIFEERLAEMNSKQAADRKEKCRPLIELLEKLKGGKS